MSYHVNLTKQPMSMADWASCEFESPETLADLCYWKLPLKVHFDDDLILQRFLSRLHDEYAEPPEEIWVIHDVRTDKSIAHPTWEALYSWLGRP